MLKGNNQERNGKNEQDNFAIEKRIVLPTEIFSDYAEHPLVTAAGEE